MSTKALIAILIFGVISSVLFGIGAVVVLATPSLSKHAATLLPAIVVASLVLAPFVSWLIAPRLRSRFSRVVEARRAISDR